MKPTVAAKKKPRLKKRPSPAVPDLGNLVVRAVERLGAVRGIDVYAHIQKTMPNVPRGSVFRQLDQAAAAGRLGMVQLGRARYFHRPAPVAAFHVSGATLQPVDLPEKVAATLLDVAPRRSTAAVVLFRP